MGAAVERGSTILHTSEACLSGYPGVDIPSFQGFDWNRLRRHTRELCNLAARFGIWLVLGSAHFLDEDTKPTNCLYLVAPDGQIVDRYDKCMCTRGDQKHYSAGNRLVTRTIGGVTIGLAICYDVCYPQIYAAYREAGATVMLHSFHNARSERANCLDVLNEREVPTRCADNRMWAVANNSSQPYSHWASFVARPDATVAVKLRRNRAGMLVHDFPDGLSEGGWYHNELPLVLADSQPLHFGVPSHHPRQRDGSAVP
jgi:predicted amidohydrolase